MSEEQWNSYVATLEDAGPHSCVCRALDLDDVEEEESPSQKEAESQRNALGYALLNDAVTSGAFSARSAEYVKYSKLRGSIVCIEGIISAGKTTLGLQMSKYLNDLGIHALFYQEFVEESLLHLFYSNPAKYAFAFQIFMLRSCMANLSAAEQQSKADGRVCIIDRSLWGNAVFAAMQRELGNISDDEWAVYLRILKTKAPCMADYVVYLDCNPASSLERMKNRGRESESSVPLEYLQNLERHYTTEMLLHVQQQTANVVPVLWDAFGTVPAVLDAMLRGAAYRVAGDPAAAFRADRAFRARAVARLARDACVDLGAPQ